MYTAKKTEYWWQKRKKGQKVTNMTQNTTAENVLQCIVTLKSAVGLAIFLKPVGKLGKCHS